MKEENVSPKLYVIVAILVIVLGCMSAIIAAAIGILPDIARPEAPATAQPTTPVQQVTQQPIVVTDTPSSRRFFKAEIDAALGYGNWDCFPDRLDRVAWITIPPDFIVNDPITEVDKQGVRYKSGQIVPSGRNATVWLNGALSDRQQCTNP